VLPLLLALAVAGVEVPAAALLIEVRDVTAGALPGTIVSITQGGNSRDAVADAGGQASFDVSPGRVSVEARLDGFATARRDGVRLRPGANRLTLTLALAPRSEVVEVEGRDAASAGRGFSRVLGEAELAQLPDDPDELEEMLRRMAGPGAVLRVNGFAGGRLPPRSQIRQIRFQTSAFAAERHEGGTPIVEIETRPGLGGWQGQLQAGLRQPSWNSRGPLSPSDTPESYQRFSASLDGPIEKGRSALSLALSGRFVDDTRTVRASLPTGPFSAVVPHALDRPEASLRAERTFGAFALRGEWTRFEEHEAGLGVGGFDLPERGLERDLRQQALRLRGSGVLFRKLALDSRLELRGEQRSLTPRSSDPALLVNGAFSAGGAQREAELTDRAFSFFQDVDWSQGRHALRAGLSLERLAREGRDSESASGTTTFGSLDDLDAGRPQLFTQRLGDPSVDLASTRSALYLQDDWKRGPRLTLSGGLRLEAQSGLGARPLPRAGIAWSPRSKLTLQAGFGLFTDWLALDVEQTAQQLDGERQRELRLVEPAWPIPSPLPALPPSLVRLAPGLRLPVTAIGSLGLSWTPRDGVRAGLELLQERSGSQFHGWRGNPLLADGTRTDPALGEIDGVIGDGRARRDSLRADLMLGGPGRPGSLFAVYILSRSRSEADAPLALFASEARRDLEWGPALDDRRHRLLLFGTRRLSHGVRLTASFNWESGLPYDVTTGRDDDGDGIVNDRPAGLARNHGRGASRADLGLRLTWSRGLGGPPRASGPRPVAVRIGGGDVPDLPDGGAAARYRLALHLLVQNALDRLDPLAYSGVLSSPTFGEPISAAPGRRIELGATFSF
jgi:hypothetical protein